MKKIIRFFTVLVFLVVLLAISFFVATITEEGRTKVNSFVEKITDGKISPERDGWFFYDTITFENVNYDINQAMDFHPDYAIQSGDIEKYELTGDVKELLLEVGGTAFRKEISTDGKFYVQAKKVGKFQGFVENGLLRIITTGSAKEWKNITDSEVVLFVPTDYLFETITIQMGAGTFVCDRLEAKQFEIKLDAGTFTASNLKAEDMSITSNLGSMECLDIVTNNLKAELGTGEAKLSATTTGDVVLDCSMGSLNLTLTGDEKAYNTSVDCAAGTVRIGDTDYSSMTQTQKRDNGADKKIDVDCAVGVVNIDFR